jgi:hypothetical protein
MRLNRRASNLGAAISGCHVRNRSAAQSQGNTHAIVLIQAENASMSGRCE